MPIEDLIGKSLEDFRVVKMVEVYNANEDGRYVSSVGCFPKEELARAYARSLPDAVYKQLHSVIGLTDGVVFYPIEGQLKTIKLEKVKEAIRKEALSKLTLEEIEVLGLGAIYDASRAGSSQNS